MQVMHVLQLLVVVALLPAVMGSMYVPISAALASSLAHTARAQNLRRHPLIRTMERRVYTCTMQVG